MILSIQEIEQLEAYWAGTLASSEKIRLEKRLEEDELFATEAKQLQLIIKGLKGLREKRLRGYLQEKAKSLPPILINENESRPFVLNRSWKILAAFLIISIGLCLWWMQDRSSKKSNEDITEEWVWKSFDPPYPFLRQNLSDVNPIYRLYTAGDFDQAIPLLKEKFENQRDTMDLFYLGISYIGNKQGDLALPIFEQLQYSNQAPQPFARWYLILAHLLQGNEEKALPILEVLAKEEWRWQQRALQLMEELSGKK